jgi:hypothetical protein
MKIGTNDHDDAEDALTGIVEQRKKPGLSVSQISDMLPI